MPIPLSAPRPPSKGTRVSGRLTLFATAERRQSFGADPVFDPAGRLRSLLTFGVGSGTGTPIYVDSRTYGQLSSWHHRPVLGIHR